MAARPRVTRRLLRKGLRVTVAAPGAGTVTAKLVAAGRTIARGTTRAAGAGTVRVRVSEVARRRAARERKVTLVVAMPGATTTSATIRKR